MPGGDRLTAELGVKRDTVEAALQRLEKEGLLINQGRRRGRRIAEAVAARAMPRIRVAILLSEKADQRLDHVVELVHELEEAGHTVSYASRTLTDLGTDVRRVALMVGKTEADA